METAPCALNTHRLPLVILDIILRSVLDHPFGHVDRFHREEWGLAVRVRVIDVASLCYQVVEELEMRI